MEVFHRLLILDCDRVSVFLLLAVDGCMLFLLFALTQSVQEAVLIWAVYFIVAIPLAFVQKIAE